MRKPSAVVVIALPGSNVMIALALPTPNAIARAFFTKTGSSWTKSVDMRATSSGTMSDSHSRRFATWAFSFEPLGGNPQIAAATHISAFFVHGDLESRKNAHSGRYPFGGRVRQANGNRDAAHSADLIQQASRNRERAPPPSRAYTSAKCSTSEITGSKACDQTRCSSQEP